ncbi:AAA family ATPase [Paenibacillus harenae]|uniref:AAA family ATPase n=1 Tax=Paenibacillus harenae TaxID=306543 RepID=UPI002792E8C6|nr:AAA family ATPase [Paenibacillus harenae]MDQ0063443.1 NadR type nicotinamide-nucleotide adenylyltransferase [Paenibacillus harenae]
MGERRIGLTLGKYAPFHRGHQYVVETALREMDDVIVIIYDCPETIDIPLPVRAGWIRKLYPRARVIEAWGGPNEMGYTPEIKRMHELYVLGLLDGQRITHFYSSEPYGEHMSEALGAADRRVDMERTTYKVSGTAVRESPYEKRAFLDPIVYRDMITKVVLLGAPSTGKTTLAASLAERYDTVWMPEYGREYWERHHVDRRLSKEQLVEIAEGHIEREEGMFGEARRYAFVDTNAITTYMFSLYYHGEAHPRLAELAELAATRYDLVFVCDTDVPYDDTWDRSGDVQRMEFQAAIIADSEQRGIPYTLLSGTVEQRVRKVAEVLEGA